MSDVPSGSELPPPSEAEVLDDPSLVNGRKLVRRLAWPVIALLAIILGTAFGLVAFAIAVSPGADIAKIAVGLSEGNSIARVVTLVIVVPALGLLAAIDRGNGSAVIAALSAIAGYVLGGTMPGK